MINLASSTKTIYAPRAIGQFLIAIAAAVYVYYSGLSPWFYLLAIFTGLIWPNLNLLIAQHVKDVKNYELLCFTYVDCYLAAAWMPICAFSPWYIVLIVSGMGMAIISIGGFRMFLKSLFTMVCSVLTVGLLMYAITDNYHIVLETPFIGIVASASATILFAYVVATNVYVRSIRLKKTKVELAEANNEVNQINQIMKIANASLNLDDMLADVSKILKESFNFDFMSIQLYDDKKREFTFYTISGVELNEYLIKAIKHICFKSADKDVFFKSIFKGNPYLYVEKVNQNELVSPLEVELYKIRPFLSLVMFPLVLEKHDEGIMSFYSNSSVMSFDKKALNKLKTYVVNLAAAINNAYLFVKLKKSQQAIHKKNNELADLSNKLSHYLAPQIYESIFVGGRDVKVDAKRKKLTIFFSDIAGFTELTDRIESEVLTSLLNTYLTRMSAIAVKHGGTIDKYIGDAILIFFGDPISKGARNDAFACVSMAVEMRDELEKLKVLWVDEGFAEALSVRMGVNSGYCNVGNFGSEYRMDYTIIGSEVNLSSRIQYAANPGEILISEETYLLVKDRVDCEHVAPLTLKGINHLVQAYRVIAIREQLQ